MESPIDHTQEQDRAARVRAWKRQAGEAAAAQVEDGMVVGLGTGSTAYWAIQAIGERLRSGRLRDIVGIATSEASAKQASGLGIPLTTLAERPSLDLAIDGADEVAPDLGLIKGGGGALVREKIVASRAERFLVVADDTKLVPRLGRTFALPVAVVPFGWPAARERLDAMGASVDLRMAESDLPFVTDDGLFVLDAHFAEGIAEPAEFEGMLEQDPAVVCTGLFLGLAERAFVGGPDGLRELQPVGDR